MRWAEPSGARREPVRGLVRVRRDQTRVSLCPFRRSVLVDYASHLLRSRDGAEDLVQEASIINSSLRRMTGRREPAQRPFCSMKAGEAAERAERAGLGRPSARVRTPEEDRSLLRERTPSHGSDHQTARQRSIALENASAWWILGRTSCYVSWTLRPHQLPPGPHGGRDDYHPPGTGHRRPGALAISEIVL